MARGDNPIRTPVYGGALIVVAIICTWIVDRSGLPAWSKWLLLLVMLLLALVGWLMTFRDLTPSRRRRGTPSSR